ncbi:MAG: GntR family transcriptional regulator [Ruminococcus sp.]|nr:GntR family transcriptional regulator [Ruminococcus sp.]MBQ7133586.1 GntR family transcriptional regulator [Ruminococcus sp.]
MKWTLDKAKPLCPQICEQVCLSIALGEFKPGEKMFSVRETALNAGVNPNTVQKAFEQLEIDGILYSVRGSGWFVCEDISKAKETLDNLVAEKTEAFFSALNALSMDNEAIKKYVKEWDNE